MKKLILTLLICLCATVAFSASSTPEDEALEHEVRLIAHKLRCPTCQSMSVKDSEAGLSLNMKAMIRDMLVKGKSEEQILAFFVDRYGEWILREPSKSGFNLLLWGLPGVLMAFAFIGVLWRAKARSVTPETHAENLSPEEQAEIDKDMQLLTKE